MKRTLGKLRKIQWRLTFTYMAATLIMLFLVELLVLISNNKNSFSNPFFINNSAKYLSEVSSDLVPYLEKPYDQELINQWIIAHKSSIRSIAGGGEQKRHGQGEQSASLFKSKPVPFSEEESILIVTDPQGIIIGSDNPTDFPVDQALLDYMDQNESVLLQEVISGSQNSVVYSNANIQYASFAFPIIQNGESRGIIFMRIAAPTIFEQTEAAFEGFLPDLPVFIIAAILVGFVFGSILAGSFTTRIRKLIDFTSRWGKGDFARIKDVEGGDEINELSVAMNQMVNEFEGLLESKKKLAVLEERNRFARDLHDSVKQQIFSISMNLSAIKSLIESDPEKAKEQLEITANIAKQAKNELSTLIYTLTPVELENQSLDLALKEYIRVWEKTSGISVVFRTHGKQKQVFQEIEQSIFRITQEALANIARHSKASATSVNLDYLSDSLQLQISDNGIGFDQNAVKKGLGLRSISERVLACRGTFDVDSGASGTTLTLVFPYERPTTGEENESK
jgi:NarL family two-component system sensor histidine kinase LiaS